jgi:glycosyltransferase involved in cell wall biosynthesis
MVSILWPSRGTYATFIHAHLKHLPVKTQILHGGNFPRFYGDYEPLESHSLLYRLYRKIAVSVFNVPRDSFQKKGLTRFLIKNGVDVVLAEMPQIAAAVLPSVRAAQKPLFVYFHGSDVFLHPDLVNIPFSELFQYATGIFVVSREQERQLLELGAPRHKLFYNPCGVDISLFQEGDPSKTPPIFLFVGRFVDKKAPHLSILAFKKVVEAIPEARLLMIGEGNLW